jgi:large subunit ribosomal protein L21
VLLYSDGDDVRVGQPKLEGVKVTAEVVEHGREKKITVFKMKRRKGYRRKKGHRQDYTLIRIKEIKG